MNMEFYIMEVTPTLDRSIWGAWKSKWEGILEIVNIDKCFGEYCDEGEDIGGLLGGLAFVDKWGQDFL
jgi:hypothetical protein